jgi:hypothetical protein
VTLQGRGTEYVHRLVAEAFLRNPSNLPQVNHKNRDRKHNHVKNLEWVTCAENNRHTAVSGSYANRYHVRGEDSGKAKLTEDDVRQMRALSAAGHTHRMLSTAFGVSYTTAARVARRETWEHVL